MKPQVDKEAADAFPLVKKKKNNKLLVWWRRLQAGSDFYGTAFKILCLEIGRVAPELKSAKTRLTVGDTNGGRDLTVPVHLLGLLLLFLVLWSQVLSCVWPALFLPWAFLFSVYNFCRTQGFQTEKQIAHSDSNASPKGNTSDNNIIFPDERFEMPYGWWSPKKVSMWVILNKH